MHVEVTFFFEKKNYVSRRESLEEKRTTKFPIYNLYFFPKRNLFALLPTLPQSSCIQIFFFHGIYTILKFDSIPAE